MMEPFIISSLEVNGKVLSSMKSNVEIGVSRLNLTCFDGLRINAKSDMDDLNDSVVIDFLMSSDWTLSIASWNTKQKGGARLSPYLTLEPKAITLFDAGTVQDD